VEARACKDFAAECLRLSQSAKTAEHRAILIGMAESWNRMARDLEEEAANPKRQMRTPGDSI
jgi:hypothetical protein